MFLHIKLYPDTRCAILPYSSKIELSSSGVARMAEETLYTVAEVAQRLKIRPDSVRRFIREGTLRASRLGTGPKAKMRIPESALKEFLSK